MRGSQCSLRSGFSLIELVIVIAIAGILLGVGAVSLRAPASRLFANDLVALIQQARFEAIKRNRPVAVTWDANEGVFESRVNFASATPEDACAGGVVLNSKRTADYRRVIVTGVLDGWGLAWLPNGQGTQCGGGATGAVITVADGSTSREVVISLVGGVAVR